MPAKFASVTTLPHAEGENWRAAVGDLLAEEGVRGVVVTLFYQDRHYMIRKVNVSQSDLALISVKLARIAAED